MGNGFRGSKYNRDMSLKDVAKAYRADIKDAKKAGKLPASLKLSVRTEYFSMGCAMRVHVADIGDEYVCEHQRPDEYGDSRLAPSKKLQAVIDRCEDMLQAYNRDNSDSMVDYFDVKFYGSVGMGTLVHATLEQRNARRAATAAVKANDPEAARAAQAAAEACGVGGRWDPVMRSLEKLAEEGQGRC